MIKAPFNFVPVNEYVYFPVWAVRISHDVPFSDGISGYIPLRITAETPLFVRNGHALDDNTDNRFSQTEDGRYFIPGTSIKGELRNVLEILSFGKMGQVQNERFGYRDLSKSALGNLYLAKIKPQNIHCGWLYRAEDRYYVRDCGLPWRISPKEIDKWLGTDLDSFVEDGDFKKDENRAAKVKYDKIYSLTGQLFPDGKFISDTDSKKPRLVRLSESKNGFSGHLVVTGQSGKRDKEQEKGKYYEFIFEDVKKDIIPIDENLLSDFLNIHKESPDYLLMWSEKLRKGEEIPVFFSFKDTGRDIEAMGSAYMFKYPTSGMIYSAMPEQHLMKNIPDMAECIFGYVGKSIGSLKGRVAVSNAFACGEVNTYEEVSVVLSSPNPSYYPLYVNGGHSWNAGGIRIAGRKRYPVRNKVWNHNAGTEDMASRMIPVSKGSCFECKVRFFNLRPVELGALLSAITFHGRTECFHSLGEARPLGYGKVKMEIPGGKIHSDTELSVDELMKSFEELMEKETGPGWKSSPQLAELFSMAKGIPDGLENNFTYLQMSTASKQNEFKQCKEKNEHLDRFSEIISGKSSVPRSVSQDGPRQYMDVLAAQIKKAEDAKIRDLEGAYNAYLEARRLFETGARSEAEALLSEARHCSDFDFVKDDIEALSGKIMQAIQAECDNFNKLVSEAAQAECDHNYDVALKLYRQADAMGRQDFTEKIISLEKLRDAASCSSISDFLSTLKLSSPAAFAGSLQKKWIAVHGELTDADANSVGNFIKEQMSAMSRKDRETWTNFNKWKVISEKIGEAVSRQIFEAAVK